MRKKTCKSPLKRASRLAFGCLATGASLLFGLTDSASAQVSSTGRFSYAQQPDGTWNRIELFQSSPGLTYDGAAAAAQGMGGFLFTPRSNTENRTAAGLNSEAWIGIDDIATEGQWKLIDNGETIWTGLGSGGAPAGGPVAGKYHNWNGAGEPNDVGGEDAAVILPSGAWNDLPNANPGVGRNFIVEFPTGATTQPDPAPGLLQAAAGKWNVRRINGTPDMPHLGFIETAMYTGQHGGTADYQLSTINFNDQGTNAGLIPNDSVLPGDNLGNGDENFFAIYARGRVRIETEGDYTFGFSGDDGAELRIHGQNFISSTNIGDGNNGNFIRSNISGFPAHEGDRISYPNPTGAGNVLGVVHLTPGDYDLTYKWYENGGGANAEVFAAPGAHTAFNSQFRPIGAKAANVVAPTLQAPLATALAQIPELGGDPSAPAVSGWDVGRINGPNNLGAAIAAMQPVIDDPLSNPPQFYEVHQTVSFADEVDGGGNIGFPQVVFPGNVAGGENDFAIAAVTDMTVTEPGLYRFTVNGDDGSRFRIIGSSGWTAAGIAATDPTGVAAPADGFIIGGCCSDGYGEVMLAPGTHRVELIWNEIGGGAYVSVRYSLNGAGNFLLGSSDGISVPAGLALVPEPSSFVLVGMGLVGAVVGLRRRRRS